MDGHHFSPQKWNGPPVYMLYLVCMYAYARNKWSIKEKVSACCSSEHRWVRAVHFKMRKVSTRQSLPIKRAPAEIVLQSRKQVFEAAVVPGLPQTYRCRILQRLSVMYEATIRLSLTNNHKWQRLYWAQKEIAESYFGPESLGESWWVPLYFLKVRKWPLLCI